MNVRPCRPQNGGWNRRPHRSVPPLLPPDGDARCIFEERDRRRSPPPLVFARPIRDGRTGREDPAGLSGGSRDRIRAVSEFGFEAEKEVDGKPAPWWRAVRSPAAPVCGSPSGRRVNRARPVGPGVVGADRPGGAVSRRLEYIFDYILKRSS